MACICILVAHTRIYYVVSNLRIKRQQARGRCPEINELVEMRVDKNWFMQLEYWH